MAKRCDLTGRGVQTGNNVSHAHNKTRRRFLPNLQETSILSDALGSTVRLRVCARTLRSIEHKGGLDSFLLNTRDANLTETGVRLKKRIRRALEAKAA